MLLTDCEILEAERGKAQDIRERIGDFRGFGSTSSSKKEFNKYEHFSSKDLEAISKLHIKQEPQTKSVQSLPEMVKIDDSFVIKQGTKYAACTTDLKSYDT